MEKSYYKLTELGELREKIAKSSYENLLQAIFNTRGSWRKWEDMDDKSKKLHYKFADKMITIIQPLLDRLEPINNKAEDK